MHQVEILWILSKKFCFIFIPGPGCPDLEWFFPEPAKSFGSGKKFGSDRIRLRIRNTRKGSKKYRIDDILHISLEKLDLEGRIRIHNTVGEGGDGARVGGQKEDGGTKELQESKQKIEVCLYLNVACNQVGLDCRSTGGVNAVRWRNGFYCF